MLKCALSLICVISLQTFIFAQNLSSNWYSESNDRGIIIQNSFPKGGLYAGTKKEHHNYSALIFFSRVINKTNKTIELFVDLPSDPISIPNAPNTYLELYLASDSMTLDKQSLFNYGFTDFDGLDSSTLIHKNLDHNEEHLFYVVAIFYQTSREARNESKGGNRSELFFDGQKLFYSMLPQIDSMSCGFIRFTE